MLICPNAERIHVQAKVGNPCFSVWRRYSRDFRSFVSFFFHESKVPVELCQLCTVRFFQRSHGHRTERSDQYSRHRRFARSREQVAAEHEEGGHCERAAEQKPSEEGWFGVFKSDGASAVSVSERFALSCRNRWLVRKKFAANLRNHHQMQLKVRCLKNWNEKLSEMRLGETNVAECESVAGGVERMVCA